MKIKSFFSFFVLCLLMTVAFLSGGFSPPDATAQSVWSYTDSTKKNDSILVVSPPATFTAGTITVKTGAAADTLTFQHRVSYTSNYVTQQVVDLSSGNAVSSAVIVPANTTRQYRFTTPVITGVRIISTSSAVTVGRTDFWFNFVKPFY